MCHVRHALWALVGLALWVPTPALAHYPHDVAHWLAISPDPDTPRLATSLERIDLDILGRSDNGLDWDARLVQAVVDGQAVSGALLTPDRLVLATEGRGLLISEDRGDHLDPEPEVGDVDLVRVVPSPTVLDDGVAFAAGATSLWRTDDAGVHWTAVWTGEGFLDLDVSPNFGSDGRVCAIEADSLSCSDDGGRSWTRGPVPEHTERISVGADGRLWAAVRYVGLFLSEDEGRTWTQVPDVGDDVSAIAELSRGLVLVAAAHQAEWRSTDGGATWSFTDAHDIPVGQGDGASDFYDFFEGPDGAVYLTCWDGVGRSDDRGLSYLFYDTERPQNTHTVTVTRGADDRALAWVGTYGSGPILTDVRSLAATDFPGLRVRYTRNAPATADFGRDGVALYDEGYSTWRTADGGQTWEMIAEDPETDGTYDLTQDVKGIVVSPDASRDPFVLATEGERAMAFRSSDDLGSTWVDGVQDPVRAAAGFAVALSPRWPDEARAWAACGGAVYESDDRGRSWWILGDTGAGFVFAIAEEPDGAVLVGTNDGLWRLRSGSVSRVGFDGAVVDGVATAVDSDTVFALVPGVGWERSDDGSVSWVTLPAPTSDVPRMISMSPTYASDGTVAVAGYGGAWASTDRGASWHSIYALEDFEESADVWVTTGSWTWAAWDGASAGGVALLQDPGVVMTMDFRGVEATIRAPLNSAEGVGSVTLDGGAPEDIRMPTGSEVVWQSGVLADGWHRLSIRSIAGTVTLDDVQVKRLEERPDGGDTGTTDTALGDTAGGDSSVDDTGDGESGSGEPGRRGCGGRSAGLWLLPLALWRTRRPGRATRGR